MASLRGRVNAVVYEQFGSIARFVFALSVLRLLPRHSAPLRRWFDLDVEQPDGADR